MDPDQLASQELADLDLHCFQIKISLFSVVVVMVNLTIYLDNQIKVNYNLFH